MIIKWCNYFIAIPALEMLVKDLFLCRSTNIVGNTDTAFHDIETQREVTASMLLRLIQHTKVRCLFKFIATHNECVYE